MMTLFTPPSERAPNGAPAPRLLAAGDLNLLELPRNLLVESSADEIETLRRVRGCPHPAVLAVCPLRKLSAEEFLEEALRAATGARVLFVLGSPTVSQAVRLTRMGAFDVLDVSVSAPELAQRIEALLEASRGQQLVSLAGAVSEDAWRRYLVGESTAMREICQMVRLVANRRSTVLISGETGTGKEMMARALHSASNRSQMPMVAVNCSALPENLLEAELFGHVRGAFTGAQNQRVGRFEQAHRSTLFLDEIGDMPIDLQAKLLRAVQEREIQRIGSSETIPVDVRVIAASNHDLPERVKQGKFREDLYYRLNVVPVRMPPLRERLDDVPLLVAHFTGKICRQEGIPRRRVAPETLDRLAESPWPGNVRQLENTVEMAIALSGERETLYPADFRLSGGTVADLAPFEADGAFLVPEAGLDFERVVSNFERRILEEALRKTSGNKTQAADMLRLKRTTLTAKLRTLGAPA